MVVDDRVAEEQGKLDPKAPEYVQKRGVRRDLEGGEGEGEVPRLIS